MTTEETIFLNHYRVCVRENGLPVALDPDSTFTTYKAVDLRSGDPVAVKLIPLDGLDVSTRRQFEERAQLAQQVDHINVVRLHASGIEDDNLILLTEFLQGETAEAWVLSHGPVAPDAALRIALQVISGLGAAAFHGLTHAAIQPSNLVIARGSTAEGQWPLVKLANFELAAADLNTVDPTIKLQYVSPEQFRDGTVDFPSEMYSLGCTMWFLLTGAPPPALTVGGAQSRSQQLNRFPKPLRNVLALMMHENPGERPQDPIILAQYIRDCLASLEKRHVLATRFALPLPVVKPARVQRQPIHVPARPLAWAVLVLLLAVIGLLLFPQISPLWRTARRIVTGSDQPGKIVGVSEPVAAAGSAQQAAFVDKPITSVPADSPQLNAQNSAPPIEQPPENAIAAGPQPENVSTPTESSAPADSIKEPVVTAQSSQASPSPTSSVAVTDSLVSVPDSADPAPPAEAPEPEQDVQTDVEPVQQPVIAENSATNSNQPAVTIDEKSEPPAKALKPGAKTKSVASTAKRSTAKRSSSRRKTVRAQPVPNTSRSVVGPSGQGRVRAKFVGTTGDGRWILRLPSGETIVTPAPRDQIRLEPPHRRLRRILIPQDQPPFPPQPLYAPNYIPDA